MGRRKLPIQYITSDKSRRETFKKRIKGLKGKAEQLATLCNARVGVIVICEQKIHEAGFGAEFKDIIIKYAQNCFGSHHLMAMEKMLKPELGSSSTMDLSSPSYINFNLLALNPSSDMGAILAHESTPTNNATTMPFNVFPPPAMYLETKGVKDQVDENDAMSNSSTGDDASSAVSAPSRNSAVSPPISNSSDLSSALFAVPPHQGKLFNPNAQAQLRENQGMDLERLAAACHYPPFQGGDFSNGNVFADQNTSMQAGNSFDFGFGNAMASSAFGGENQRNLNPFYDSHFNSNVDGAFDLDFDKSMPMQAFHWADESPLTTE